MFGQDLLNCRASNANFKQALFWKATEDQVLLLKGLSNFHIIEDNFNSFLTEFQNDILKILLNLAERANLAKRYLAELIESSSANLARRF